MHFNSISIFIIAGFACVVCSCSKDPAGEANADFIGNWRHRTDATSKQVITINSDSKGYIERYENNVLTYDSNPRKWFVKQNHLLFGRFSGRDEKFVIEAFPTIATSNYIVGFDTVVAGKYYMRLDGDVYIKLP